MLVFVVVQLQRAYSKPCGHGVSASRVERCHHFGEVWLPEPIGPPQARAVDSIVESNLVDAFRQRHRTAGHPPAVGADGHFGPFDGAVGLNLDHGAQLCAGLGNIFLYVPHVDNARIAPSLEHNRPPNAEGDKARTPVPAIFKTGSTGKWRNGLVENAAYLRVVGPGVVTVWQRVELRYVPPDGAFEVHLEQVFALLEYAFHVATPLAVHVVGLADALMVEVNIGIGVEPLEHNHLVGCRQFAHGGRKSRLIHPVFLVDPLHRALVEPEKRVVYNAFTHEVEMGVARDTGRMPYLRTALSEAPAVVKRALAY